MRFLKTNTATRITVGPFFDKTDGVTPETGITVTSCKLTFTVDDAGVPTLVLDTAPTASGGNNDMVHITGDDAGFYDLELTAANVNYVGRAMLAITDAAVHCPVFHEFTILPANVYDSLISGSDALQVHTNEITANLITASVVADGAIDAATFAAGAITATVIATGAIDADAIADNAIDAGAIAADAITAAKIANGAIDAATFAADVDAEVRDWLGMAAADLDTQLDTIGGDVSNLYDTVSDISTGLLIAARMPVGASGNDTTHVHLDTLTFGDDEINNLMLVIWDVSEGELHTRWIDDWVLSTELATVSTLPFTPVNTDFFWILAMRRDVTVASYQTGMTPLQPTVAGRTLDVSAGGEAGVDWANVGSATTTVNLSGTTVKDATDVNADTDTLLSRMGTPSNLGGGATVAANLADIEGQTDDIGTAGAGLTAVPWSAAWDAEVQSEVQDALEANNLDHLVKAAVDTDFATTVHLNSVVGHLADNGSSATFDRTTDSLEALQAEHDTTQSAISGLNNLSQANVRTAVGLTSANLDTQLDALPTNAELATALGTADDATLAAIAALNNISPAQVNSEVDTALADVGLTTTVTGRIDAAISSRSTLTAAQANAEVVDALTVDVIADSIAADGSRPTIAQALLMINRFLMEKSVSSTTVTVKKEDGTTSSMTFTLNDATTPTSITRAS